MACLPSCPRPRVREIRTRTSLGWDRARRSAATQASIRVYKAARALNRSFSSSPSFLRSSSPLFSLPPCHLSLASRRHSRRLRHSPSLSPLTAVLATRRGCIRSPARPSARRARLPSDSCVLSRRPPALARVRARLCRSPARRRWFSSPKLRVPRLNTCFVLIEEEEVTVYSTCRSLCKFVYVYGSLWLV